MTGARLLSFIGTLFSLTKVKNTDFQKSIVAASLYDF